MAEIKIKSATKGQAAEIASLIMEAMDYDCCQNLAGPDHTLDDFHAMMTELVRMEDSQYSYRNTLVAVASLKKKNASLKKENASLKKENASLKNKEERIKNTEPGSSPSLKGSVGLGLCSRSVSAACGGEPTNSETCGGEPANSETCGGEPANSETYGEALSSEDSNHEPLSSIPNTQNIAGCIVGYDGKDLRRLRQRFIEKAKEAFGIDYSDMDDETREGEYYLDSLCVKKEYRKHGIATALMLEAIRKHGSQPVGLLVDHTHPWAERLYKAIGFSFVNETAWGGHKMNHLQFAPRPQWALRDMLSLSYYDNEWCFPCHNDNDIFMYLIMETMSCGLSWHLMLKKREIFRKCFAGFDPHKVAEFTDDDVERIMSTEDMIRSPRKISAMINNARCFINVQKEYGAFDRYIWGFTDGKQMVYPEHKGKMIARNDLSDVVSNDLRKHGFKYVGSVITYSFLQAVGIVNDR